MAGAFQLRDRGFSNAESTSMKRRLARCVAAWEDDGGARRVRSSASAVRSRDQNQGSRLTEGKPVPLEVKSGYRNELGKYAGREDDNGQ